MFCIFIVKKILKKSTIFQFELFDIRFTLKPFSFFHFNAPINDFFKIYNIQLLFPCAACDLPKPSDRLKLSQVFSKPIHSDIVKKIKIGYSQYRLDH